MSELSIAEMETEQAELLPARETLSIHGNHNHVTSVQQVAVAFAGFGHTNTAIASNISVIG